MKITVVLEILCEKLMAMRMALLCFCGLLVMADANGHAQQQFYSLSITWARPLGMGGAFMAVADHLPALLYNPANFTLYRDQRTRRLTIFLNPIGLATAIDRQKDLHRSDKFRSDDLGSMLELFVRGLAFGDRSFQVAALIGEELPNAFGADRENFGEVSHYTANQYSMMAGRIQFADRVAIGGSIGIYYQGKTAGRKWGTGWSYGVTLLSGKNICIGISYWSFPKNMTEYRLQPERLIHEAINLGVSYKAPSGTLVAMDIRNLGEETRLPVRELHFGVEQKVFSWLALRGGYYQDRIDSRNRFSAGIGLLDQNLWRPARKQLQETDWALQYGISFGKQNTQNVYNHAFTFLLRL